VRAALWAGFQQRGLARWRAPTPSSAFFAQDWTCCKDEKRVCTSYTPELTMRTPAARAERRMPPPLRDWPLSSWREMLRAWIAAVLALRQSTVAMS
jgi:hypothetical protein